MRNVTLQKGLVLLETLASEARDFPLSELAAVTGLDKGHACRLVQSLVAMGYAVQDPATRAYRIGLRTVELSSGILTRMDLCRVGMAYLHELADRLTVTSYLGVLHLGRLLTVATQYPAGVYRDGVPGFGSVMDLYESAMGRALVADMTDEKRSELDLDPEAWAPVLAEAAETGAGIVRKPMDSDPSVIGVAAVVRGFQGRTLGALGASTSITHFEETGRERFVAAIQESARGLSFALGHGEARAIG